MNTATDYLASNSSSKSALAKIIVIGAGPVGVRFVDELKRKQIICDVTLFGNEPYDPYNRVQLSNVLSRSKDYADIVTQFPSSTDDFHFRYAQENIIEIHPSKKQITTQQKKVVDYDSLIIATGSTPHIPNIDGVNLKGVYTFRNLRDTEALLARTYRSRTTIVVGGGLLGLEAAKALSTHHTEVILIQQGERLMNRQLDEDASSVLAGHVKQEGIRVITSSGVRRVFGDQRVEGVITRDGTKILCDTVLFCTGIRPQNKLALQSGISVGRGITVDDFLQTSNENIYAIGECSEHQGQVYGIVTPGFEQAAVLADRFAGGKATYQGTQLISTLKVVGESVCSMGEVAEVTRRAKQHFLSYNNKKTGAYRKLVIHQSRLIGACAVGEWEESRRIQESFLSGHTIFPWQQWWFRITGKLWFGKADTQVANWPETAMVCQCNQISRGRVTTAIDEGYQSIEAIGKITSAGTVCGSCQPLLQNLLGSEAKPAQLTGAITILLLSIFAAVASVIFVLFPGIEPVESVQTPTLEFLWTDGWWKQVTGFSLIGIVALGLMMSLRKRFSWKFLGDFSYWRVLHVVLGLVALAILLAHTGAHLGENLNKLLMLNFLIISAVGAFAGLSLALASKISTSGIETLKKSWYWIHILVVWPLPALLIIHIFSVYYY